jgi:acetyltransferase-like isoleucine patch superfamily enzyme
LKNLLQLPDIQALINIALREDIGAGDHSSLACIENNKLGNAYCVAKDDGVICGLELAEFIFHQIDPLLVFKTNFKDGDMIKIGDNVFIGSNSAIVAPIEIKNGAIIGAGSVITKNVESDDLAVSRTSQTNHASGATKFRKSKSVKKND